MDNECRIPYYVVNNESPILPLTERLDWGLLKLNIKKLHDLNINGTGINVVFLDTGVDHNHPDLSIASYRDFTSSGTSMDKVGHGTHVAGIIGAQPNTYGVRGVAPGCNLHSYKVLSTNTGNMLDVARAIRAAADNGMDIINMSLGSPADVSEVRNACKYARDKGCILVVSSGNSGAEQRFYPSAYDYCFSVGAINQRFEVSAFSSYGSHLDIVAPGEKVLSTYLNKGYAVLSGTSMAAPFAAGCLALMKQAGVHLNYDSVTKSVIDIEDPNFDKKSGFGILDPHQSINTTPKTADEEKIATALRIITEQVNILNSSLKIS